MTTWISTDVPADSMHGLFHNSSKYDETYGDAIPKPFKTAAAAQLEADRFKADMSKYARLLARKK
jgi:hypothetical protein